MAGGCGSYPLPVRAQGSSSFCPQRARNAMAEAESIVFIIDDDPLYRASAERLVRSVGFSVQGFESARDFLSSRRPGVPSCLVLDVRLPGLSGLDLQRELADAGVHIPIIFVTGHGDIP